MHLEMRCCHARTGGCKRIPTEADRRRSSDPGPERPGYSALGRAEASQYLYAAHTELADQLIATLSGPGAASEPAYMFAQQSVILLAAREWPLAVRLLEHALELSPAYPDALVYLGYALDQMDREEEAERACWSGLVAPESVSRILAGMHYRGTDDSERRGAFRD